MKVFISQPMKGLSDKEILEKRNEIKNNIEKKFGSVEIIDSFIKDYPGELNIHIPIFYLAKSIECLSQADIVYFGGEWKNARGCKIEHEIALKYGLTILEEK